MYTIPQWAHYLQTFQETSHDHVRQAVPYTNERIAQHISGNVDTNIVFSLKCNKLYFSIPWIALLGFWRGNSAQRKWSPERRYPPSVHTCSQPSAQDSHRNWSPSYCCGPSPHRKLEMVRYIQRAMDERDNGQYMNKETEGCIDIVHIQMGSI